jgi:dethiobiotin synthetase/adenosylmethionine--8-amino-7-oxononanoate aminotransferase
VYKSFVRTFIERGTTATATPAVTIGALLLEPLMLGAGGLKFVDPLYQKVLVQVRPM